MQTIFNPPLIKYISFIRLYHHNDYGPAEKWVIPRLIECRTGYRRTVSMLDQFHQRYQWERNFQALLMERYPKSFDPVHCKSVFAHKDIYMMLRRLNVSTNTVMTDAPVKLPNQTRKTWKRRGNRVNFHLLQDRHQFIWLLMKHVICTMNSEPDAFSLHSKISTGTIILINV